MVTITRGTVWRGAEDDPALAAHLEISAGWLYAWGPAGMAAYEVAGPAGDAKPVPGLKVAPVFPVLELLAGRDLALLGSDGTGGLITRKISGSGQPGAKQVLTGAPEGGIAAAAALAGSPWLYTAWDGETGITALRLGTESVTAVKTAKGPGLITDLTTVHAHGTAFLIAASAETHGVASYQIGASGVPRLRGEIGAAEGLGLNSPAALATAQIGDTPYVIAASAGTGSLSVLKLWQDGSLSATDHVLDSRDTRFGGAASLEVVTLGERVFVVAAGSDDGLSLFALLPGGKLLHLASQADDSTLTLEAIADLAAVAQDGQIHLYGASGRLPGITELIVDPGPLGVTKRGGPQDNTLAGAERNDLLDGGAGADLLLGKGGDDILMDGRGEDRLRGGSGADTFVLAADGAADRILDFEPGKDRLDLSDWPMLYGTGQLNWTVTDWGAKIRFGEETLRIESWDGGSLTAGAVFPAGMAGPDRPPLVLADPNLRITGSRGPDTFQGGDGRDRIEGAKGDDRLTGGAGDDRLMGGKGADRLMGGSGADRVSGGKGRDTVWLGRGDDIFTDEREAGKRGADTARGEGGNDAILGGGGADRFLGGAGRDRILGGAGADRIEGGRGNDRLAGERGDDRLMGGKGADVLTGGRGNDKMLGGAGADTFRFAKGFGKDRIADFRPGTDLLALDEALWGGGLSARKVVKRFGEEVRGDLILDFGKKGVLRLEDVDGLTGQDLDFF